MHKKIENLIQSLEGYEDDRIDDITTAIELRFKHSETPIELEEAQEHLEPITSLIEELRQVADALEEEFGDLPEQVDDLAEQWDKHLIENADADELPPPPPINDPAQYKSNLFGNDPQ